MGRRSPGGCGRSRGLLIAATLLLSGAWGATADAAQRYVSPTGVAGICSQAQPCSIITGVNGAGVADEVIVGPGTYAVVSQLQNANAISIHGIAGQPRPVINSSATTAFDIGGFGSTVTDLTLEHTGSGFGLFVGGNNARIERVQVRSSGVSPACHIGGSMTVRDSLCVSTGTGSQALAGDVNGGGTATMKVRNVTAVATAPGSVGMRLGAGTNSTGSIDARNVIAMGTSADVQAVTSGPGATATVGLQSSNFDTPGTVGAGASVTAPGTGGNQSVAPVFADTTLYHQAAVSPTVDHGTLDADAGTSDLDGDPRVLGAAPDIGADELIPGPPPDTTAPTTSIGKKPKRRTKKRRAKFTFSSDEAGSTFKCRLDRTEFETCSSPFKAKRLDKGLHRFTVRATDAAGNTDANGATYQWKVKKRR